VTTDDTDADGIGATESTGESSASIEPAQPPSPARTPGSMARTIGRRLARQRHAGKVTAAIALVALIGAGYALGGPPATDNRSVDGTSRLSALSNSANSFPGAVPAAMPTSAPAAAEGGKGLDQTAAGVDGASAPVVATNQGSVIIKTGQLSLQVTDIDGSISAAQSAATSAGGYISSSNRSGSDQYATASITFRIPAAKWDDAIAALRKLGSRVLSEQTDTSDVTMQVVDLNARLDNLAKAESALQAIMARASSVPDVLAVQSQLTQTQGQIEQLTAQRDHLNDQAAMSTLTVNFSLESPTVTTQAAQDWTLANQIDQAGAALVRIGQGIVTIGVWAVIVVLPVAIGLLVLLIFLVIARRITRRGRRNEPSVA
jgi:hypothetical protein